jgi:hypothetical protein
MPLTRNLYREDEVIAALQFCVLRGRCVEAVFWASEALESGMVAEFLVAMRTIWRLGFGIGAIGWYLAFREFAAADELDMDDAIRLVVALCRIGLNGGRDHSVIVLAGTSVEAEPAAPCKTEGFAGIDGYFFVAVLQGRTISAWRALPSVDRGIVGLVAEKKHGEAGAKLMTLFEECPAVVVAGLCLGSGLDKRFSMPGMIPEVEAALKEWSSRRGRIFTIPSQSLYWLTARGRDTVYSTNEKEMRGSLERPNRLWGSIYWDEVAESFGGWEAIQKDADTREAFYDEHFPDNIPDEWSVAERAKSHGAGSMQPGAAPSLQRWLASWFGGCGSAVIWNQFDAAIRGLEPLEAIKALEGFPGTDVQSLLQSQVHLERIRRRVVPDLPENHPTPLLSYQA